MKSQLVAVHESKIDFWNEVTEKKIYTFKIDDNVRHIEAQTYEEAVKELNGT